MCNQPGVSESQVRDPMLQLGLFQPHLPGAVSFWLLQGFFRSIRMIYSFCIL